ncbi:hypothetical protein IEE94_10290 [Yimella sp. cx-573]|nr:hypothetical protein [Yimella sp. cx-573]
MSSKPIAQNAAAADAAVLVRPLVSAASAGEVADAAGTIGAACCTVLGQTGQQPIDTAAGTDAVGLTSLGVTAATDPS